MAPLAQAYVRIRPQLSEAEVRASAARAGEQAGAVMGRSMSSGLSRSVKAFAGLGAATGLIEAGRKVMEFADQFEGARARVETNTENIGASFAAVQKPLGALDSRMSAFGFTITDTENSFAQLVTATRSPVKALKDVALAADIARGRHISLDAATQILMRVETGHVAMLGRLGIATHDVSGKIFTQAQVLDALAQAYGGNAAKFAGTFAGKQAAARAEIQQSATEIGVALLPALSDLANVLAHDVLPPIASTAQWLDRNRKTVEPLVKAVLIAGAAWKFYALWTRVARRETELFAGTRLAGAVGPAAGAGRAGTTPLAATSSLKPVPVFVTNWMQIAAAGIGGGAAVGGAAAGGAAAAGVEAGAAGTAIGASMAKNLDTPLLNLASKAGFAAASIGTMGVAALGIVNFIKNPKSLGFPMGFNTDLGPGRNKVVGGAPARYFDPKGNAFSDPDLKHAIVDTNRLTASTNTLKTTANALSSAETNLGASLRRTASQMEGHVAHALALRSAQDGLRQAMHDAAQTAADNGKALRGNSDAALANRDAMRNQVSQIFAVIDAMKARGATDQAQSSMIDVLTQAVELNAIKMYGDKAAVDAFLRSVGLIPGEVANAINAVAALDAMTAAKTDLPGRDVKAGGAGRAGAAEAAAAAKKQGADVAASFNTGFSPVVSKGAESAAKAAATKFADMMKSDLQTIRDSISSTVASLRSFAAFNPSGTDTLGASGANTDFIAQKREKAQKLEQFAKLYGRLVKAGLNADDLHEFVGLGPDAIPAMEALLAAGKAGIKQENKLDKRINKADLQVAREDAAAQNLGLIHKDLQQLPPKLRREFIHALKQLQILTDVNALDHANGVKIMAH